MIASTVNCLKKYLVMGVADSCNHALAKIRTLMFVLFAGMVVSCSHPLVIHGEGDIISSSGMHDCTLADFQAGSGKCTNNPVTGEYDETYTAVPKPGWVFKGWRTWCGYNTGVDTCSFYMPAKFVDANWYQTWYALHVEFIEDCQGQAGCLDSLAPSLGAVTDNSINIWQATRGDAEFEVRYRTGSDPFTSVSVDIDETTGWVGTIQLTGLDSNTLYEYETFLNGTPDVSSTFSTLPPSDWTGQVKFGFGADFNHFLPPFKSLETIAARDYDFMLMVGDLMYAAQKPLLANDVDAYADRYWLTWSETAFAQLGLTTPFFMTWDDHEIIGDYYPGYLLGDELTDRYPAAREAFDLYQAPHNPDTYAGEIYYTFSAPGADFFVLDTRSHRDPNGDVDDIDKSMLGQTQREALLDYLEQSSAPFKFIVTSVPFSLVEVSIDTWHGFQTERELILSEIESRGVSGVVFLSGDKHFSGIFKFTSPGGFDYYDIMPTPAGTFLRQNVAPTSSEFPGETVIYANDTFKAFGEFLIDLSPEATPSLRAAIVDEDGNDQCVITVLSTQTGVISGGGPVTCE